MKTKSSHRAGNFAPGSSRQRENGVTFRLVVANDPEELRQMGARLKELRTSHGFTQQHVADICHVDKRTLQYWEAGESPPNSSALDRLTELYGVTRRFILRGPTPDGLPQAPEGVTARLSRLEETVEHNSEALIRIGATLELMREMLERSVAADVKKAAAQALEKERARAREPRRPRKAS